MAAKLSLEAQLDDWCKEVRGRGEAVFKASVQETISIMQRVGPSVANPDASGGGNMPVDTGFLRNSLQVNGVGGGGEYSEGAVSLTIGIATLGDTLTASYSANYAPQMEERYGFVRLAAMQWPQTVRKMIETAKQRVAASNR